MMGAGASGMYGSPMGMGSMSGYNMMNQGNYGSTM